MTRALAYLCLLIVTVTSCSCQSKSKPVIVDKVVKNVQVLSSAFKEGGAIPKDYTCDGKNVSPPLRWSDYPAGTKSFALICDDPDAPSRTWVHWVLYDLPSTTESLPERVSADYTLPNGAKQGTNDFGKTGYGGPCPPSGTHRYLFKVYALDTMLNLPPGASKATS